MVANAFPNATEAGARMRALGGNAVDADMRYNDGFLRADDLALIPWPIVRRALRRRYRSVTLATMPPPGAGRVPLLVMMMLIHLRSDALEQVNPENLHFFAESLRKAFLRRVDRPFDPNTYAQVQNKVLLSRLYARGLADSIRDDVDPTLPTVDPEVDEFGETTHFSVMDAEGNAVAVTRSIAPRLHCSIGGQVSLDAERFDHAVISRLQGRQLSSARTRTVRVLCRMRPGRAPSADGRGIPGRRRPTPRRQRRRPELHRGPNVTLPVLLSIPHSGDRIPVWGGGGLPPVAQTRLGVPDRNSAATSSIVRKRTPSWLCM